jgi:hypothetical protein
MSKITNNDLVLLYYGEHDDPDLAKTVASSPELSTRFEALGIELAAMDQFAPPVRDEAYGAETWMKISPQLAATQKEASGFFDSMRAALARPRFSFAGVAAVTVVAVLAFVLGRQGSQPGSTAIVETGLPQVAAMELDNGRLLTSSVSGHLDQLNIVLTEFVNMDESSAFDAERVTDMLVANRLYRQSAAARGDQKLATFLAALEPLLIELAYEAYQDSPATRNRMQQEVRDSLLFRVRAVNQHLQKSTLST